MTLEENTLPFTSSNKNDTNGEDNDDKCLPSLSHVWGPCVYVCWKKEMTVGCCSVHIDGFLGTCFMSCLGPLTYFWVIIWTTIAYYFVLFDFYIAIHLLQHWVRKSFLSIILVKYLLNTLTFKKWICLDCNLRKYFYEKLYQTFRKSGQA